MTQQQTEALNSLIAALQKCRKSGIDLKVAPLYGANRTSMIIAIEHVKLVHGKLVVCEPKETDDGG